MANNEPALKKLAQAFNETDAALRRRLLTECWAPTGQLRDEETVVATGRDGVDTQIAAALRDPEFHVKVLGAVTRSGDREWTRWRVTGLNRMPVVRSVVGRRTEDGLLSEVTWAPAAGDSAARTVTDRLLQSVTDNPIPAVGLLGGTLYVALRIPVGLFYNDLGVTPDEVGIGPQVLVPQSLTLLALFGVAMLGMFAVTAAIIPALRASTAATRMQRRGQRVAGTAVSVLLAAAVVGGLAVIIVATPSVAEDGARDVLGVVIAIGLGALPVVVVGFALRLLPPVRKELRAVDDAARRAAERTEMVKRFGVLLAVYGAAGLLVALPIWALIDADRVRGGRAAHGRITPWRAPPVALRWTKSTHIRLTNSCEALRLLGTANGQIVLFDAHLDQVFRVPIADASISVVPECRTR